MKGKILKIKMGHNPNSSGYGAMVVMIFMIPAAVIINLIISIITASIIYKKTKNNG